MEIPKIPKIPKKYNCISCDYHTSNKKDFDKHNFTLKHINGTKSTISQKNPIELIKCDEVQTHCTNNSLDIIENGNNGTPKMCGKKRTKNVLNCINRYNRLRVKI